MCWCAVKKLLLTHLLYRKNTHTKSVLHSVSKKNIKSVIRYGPALNTVNYGNQQFFSTKTNKLRFTAQCSQSVLCSFSNYAVQCLSVHVTASAGATAQASSAETRHLVCYFGSRDTAWNTEKSFNTRRCCSSAEIFLSQTFNVSKLSKQAC